MSAPTSGGVVSADPRWMDVRDVARETRCSKARAYELMWEIGPFSVGRNLRISRAAFEVWAVAQERRRQP